jgi:putative transposase
MRTAFVYRLYANRSQDKALTGLLDIARTFYNAALQERRDAWKVGVSINYYDQANQLKEIRQENSWCAALNCSATQDVLRRLDKTFKAFFRRCQSGEKPGYPRFKGRDRFNSVTFPSYGDGIKLTDKLYVQNVGRVRINLHRPIEGRIKTASIKRECGKWYAVFSCELAEGPAREPAYENPVGIDVGLTSFAVLSDGSVIDNPRYFRQGEVLLANRQRRLSARVRGSHRRRKARLLVAKAHLKVQRQRLDFHHKVARGLAQKYDFIAHEDLNIKGMVRNHCLAKSISDAAWGQFLRILCYKAEEAGGTEVGVNPSGTSIDCSRCGFPVPKTLADRQHICPNCGLSVPRDLNASLNILALGLSVQGVDPEKLPALAGRVVTISPISSAT